MFWIFSTSVPFLEFTNSSIFFYRIPGIPLVTYSFSLVIDTSREKSKKRIFFQKICSYFIIYDYFSWSLNFTTVTSFTTWQPSLFSILLDLYLSCVISCLAHYVWHQTNSFLLNLHAFKDDLLLLLLLL